VSLGEVVAAVPLVKALQERHPDYRYLVTTVTETGREAVEQRLAGVAEHRYAPLDFPWAVGGMIRRWRPILYLFIETELWPNLLWRLARRGIPAILVNGRLSSRSFARQDLPIVRDFYRSVLESLALCLMQSRRDADRIQALGAPQASVHVTGNIKFDQPVPMVEVETAFRTQLGVGAQDLLFLAGSTHPGEEEQLVAAYQRLVDRHPSLVLMLAPRHIERAEDVERMARHGGCAVLRRSRLSGVGAGPRVIVLDTRGELARAYREAVVAYVGGTLIPVGGHNVLEPAVWGKPVLFGPHTDHCAEIAAMLEEAGGAHRVTGSDSIVEQVDAWLHDPAGREAAGQAARGVVAGNQGALARSLQLIEPYLRPSSACGDSVRLTDPVVARG
jgi:3-deoxy-D-manno-octulosonic-acid transferase